MYRKYFYHRIGSLLKGRKLIIFGCGVKGKFLLNCIKDCTDFHVDCLCDNNPSRICIDNVIYNVISPFAAAKLYKDGVYIIANYIHCKEMEEQLLELGILKENIYCMDRNLEYECMKYIPQKQYDEIVRARYKECGLGELNLDNPQTYNEYIIWEMLHDVTPIKKRLVDKLLVREWIKERIGEEYLIPIYGVWEKVEDIEIDKLPGQFVLKANHGCGYNLIVPDKRNVLWEKEKIKLQRWLETDYSYHCLELQYQGIKPCIICEKYLENNGKLINDYKVFCFHGKPYFVMFLTDRNTELKMSFYDTNWEKMDFVYNFSMYKGRVPKPKCLDKMLQLSGQLSEGFRQVRVDWYILDDGTLKFGEMTFSTAAGILKWNPPEWNEKLGKLMREV